MQFIILQALTLSESSSAKSSAMTFLPFQFDDDLLEKFKELNESNPTSVNWLEMNVSSETVHLAKPSLISDFSSLREHINPSEGR